MDGLKAFGYICDNVPAWQEKLQTLAYNVNERHLEFTRLARMAGSDESLRRRRTGSTESLRPEDETPPLDASPDRSKLSSPPMRVEINPDAKRLFQEYRVQSKRKRPSASIVSNTGTNTSVPRSRMALIVYYDSAIQESFESMVRAIAAARNTLRKGKTAAGMRARMVGMAAEESPFEGNRTSFSLRNHKIPRLSFRGGAYQSQPFDQVDKELETAQTLCEIGAHQFLRDGTCQQELAGAQERLNGILQIAQEQRAVYEEEAKVEAAQETARDRNRPQLTNRVSAVGSGVPLVDGGMPAVDTGISDLLAVDEAYAGPASNAMDPAADSRAADPARSGIAVDSAAYGIAVDSAAASTTVNPTASSVTKNPLANSTAIDSHTALVAVDPTADSGIAIDPAYEGTAVDPSYGKAMRVVDPSAAMDSTLTVEPHHIAVDPSLAIDRGSPLAVDSSVKIDPVYSSEAKTAGYRYSTGPIEVDDRSDGDSCHIDLTAFRRTRGM